MPALGFGCSPFRPGGRIGPADLEEAVRTALAAGYRLFDLAEVYGTERAVGRALRSSQAPSRAELFLVGKAWRTSFRPAALRAACEGSLRRLAAEAFDLYLLHAPEAWKHRGPLVDPEEEGWEELEHLAGQAEPDDVPLAETWEAMHELVEKGLAGAIGVSNFSPAQIEALGAGLPAANEIESSPYRPHPEIADWCRGCGIALLAYSPLSSPASSSSLLAEPVVVETAVRHGCSPAAVALRWNIQRGLVPLSGSLDPAHIVGNLRALEIELDSSEMALLGSLAGRTGER